MKIKFLIISLITLFSLNVNAQGEGVLPFMNLSSDPQSLGMGLGGASSVSNDPMGYTFNPALLGYFSQKVNLSYQTYAELPNWLPSLTDVKLFNNSFTLGYKFENLMQDLNVSAGFGYSRFKFSYGSYQFFDENGNLIRQTSESYDRYNAYTVGLCFDYFVNLSFGMGFKNITSELPYSTSQNPDPQNMLKINAKTTDWGLLLSVPVLKLIDKDLVYKTSKTELKPFVNFALGYSRLNKGDEISYIDPLQKGPLPLSAHLGYNLNFGTDIELFDNTFRLVDVNFNIDASDVLIGYDQNTGKYYQSGLGDINIGKNLFQWKPTDKNDIRKGRSLTLFETVTLLGGSVNGPGHPDGLQTNGVVVNSAGLFKMLSSVVFNNDPYTKYILSHLELKYATANIYVNDPLITTMSSFSVTVKNLSLW